MKEYLKENLGSMLGLFIPLLLWYALTIPFIDQGCPEWLMYMGFTVLFFTSYILTGNGK